MRNIFFRIFIVFFSFIFLINFINAQCNIEPNKIFVYSGSKLSEELNYGSEFVYIKGDLSQNPLKIEFYFRSDDESCFQNAQIKMRLFSTGSLVNANSITTRAADNSSYFETIAIFDFRVDVKISETFISTYSINLNNGSSILEGDIIFNVDVKGPKLEIFNENKEFYSKGERITIGYTISDEDSGLEKFTISGLYDEEIEFDTEKNYQGEFTFQLNESGIINFLVLDKLAFSNTTSLSFFVDNIAPIIDSSSFRQTFYFDTQRKVSFEIKITDESFKNNLIPKVIGDFSLLNSLYSSSNANCEKTQLDNEYKCRWSNIPIDETLLNQTKIISINISAEDQFQNVANISINTEIFIDKTAPEIIHFYLENKFGIRNIFSSSDFFTKLYLKYDDESEIEKKILSSDKIQFLNYDDNLSKPEKNEFVWLLGNSLQAYEKTLEGEAKFEIYLEDTFGNKIKKIINVTIDNIKPIIHKIEILESGDIKDGVFQSQEKIKFRLLIEDKNLLNANEHFIYGNFTNIVENDDIDEIYKKGICSAYNLSIYQCDFNIVLKNGYFNSSVYFDIYDIAGNLAREEIYIEVFRVADETYNAYKIEDLKILNPINRNRLLTSGRAVDTWFKGEIKLINPSDKFEIISYLLKNCNEGMLNPLIAQKYNFYPEPSSNIIFSRDDPQTDISKFAFFVKLQGTSVVNELNDKEMQCQIALVKADSENIYPSEFIDFNLYFSFYDLPRGSLLNAEAENILSFIESADKYGKHFDTVYDIYKIFETSCNLINSATGVIGSLSSVIQGLQVIMGSSDIWSAGASTATVRNTMGKSAFGSLNFMGEIRNYGPIKMMCDFVSCTNGGLLASTYASTEMGQSIGDILDKMNNVIGSACSPDIDPGLGGDK